MSLDLFINTMAGATHIHGTAGGGGGGVCGGSSLAIYRDNGHLIRDRAKQSQATVQKCEREIETEYRWKS